MCEQDCRSTDVDLFCCSHSTGENTGIVNNCTWLSNVASSYAPPGQALLSATVIGIPDMSNEELVKTVTTELSGWFGKESTDTWRSLAVQKIPYCQPPQEPDTNLERYLEAVAESIWLVACCHVECLTVDLVDIFWFAFNTRLCAHRFRGCLVPAGA